METSNIPRFFWIALSFCMVVATLGVLGIAWQSASVSIEIANAKITMSSALSDVKEIKTGLEKENQKLLEEKESLESLLAELKQSVNNPQQTPEKILEEFLTDAPVKTDIFQRENRLKDLGTKIDAVEKTIRKE